MAETQREKVQRIGRAFRDAPDVMRKGGFGPLEFADAVYRLINNQQAATANEDSSPTAIDIRPKNIEVRTLPPVQPLMGPNNVFASSIDPNTGTEFSEADELDADNIAISLLQDLPADPAASARNKVTADVVKGVKYGSDLAKAQNQEGLISQAADTISGLLGNVDFQGLFRVLARPEFVAPMGPGQSPLTNFVNAAAADRTSQAALRAARQEAGLERYKAETDRLKALMPDPSKMPKLTGEANKLYDSMAAAENTARLGKQIQESLSKSKMVSGAPGAAAEGFRAVAAFFGADPGEMEQDEVKKRIASLKKEILESRAFGKEANKQELEILNRLVQQPDLFTSRTQILNSIKSLTESAERRRFNVAARLKAFGLPTEFNATKPEGPGFTRNN